MPACFKCSRKAQAFCRSGNGRMDASMVHYSSGLPPVQQRFFPNLFGPKERERRSLRQNATAVGFTILGYLAISILLPYPLFWMVSWLFPGSGVEGGLVWVVNLTSEAIGLFTYICALLFPFLLYAHKIKIPREKAMPLRPVALGLMIPAVLLGLGATSLGNFLSLGLEVFFSSLGFSSITNLPNFTGSAPADIVVLLSSTLVAATVEEFAFRGVLLQSLRRHGDGFAVVVSALLFALCHATFAQFFPAFLSGLVLGYFAVVTGSLWVGFITHLVYNSIAVGINLWVPLLSEPMQTLVSFLLSATLLALGLGAAFVISLRHENAFILRPSGTLLSGRDKCKALFTSVSFVMCIVVLVIFTLQSLAPIGW